MSATLCPAGKVLLRWLTKHGKTQVWLAEELGAGRASIWRWLTGEQTPRIETALRIRAVTGIPVEVWSKRSAA